MPDMIYKGEQAKISFALENSTAYGAIPTPGNQTIWLGVIPSANIEVVPDYNDYYSLTQGASSTQRDLFVEKQSKINCSGDFPLELQNGRVLYYAMGLVTENSTSAPYTHTIQGAGNAMPSIVGEAVYAGDNQTFMRYLMGMKINTFSLEMTEGAQVTSTVNFINANTSRAVGISPSTVSTNTTKPWQFFNGCITYNNETQFRVVAATWSINNNLKPLWDVCSQQAGSGTGGQYASSIEAGKREYELRLTMLIPDQSSRAYTIWDDFITGPNRDVRLQLTRTAGSDYMRLDAYNCTIRTAPYNLPEVGEEVRVDVVLKPRRCVWTVVDNIASYD